MSVRTPVMIARLRRDVNATVELGRDMEPIGPCKFLSERQKIVDIKLRERKPPHAEREVYGGQLCFCRSS
jgi:hypothetical protein